MPRTRFYLDETRYQFLVQLAQRTGGSIAHAVRDLIDERMAAGAKRKKRADPFWKVVGAASGDGGRVAENYEDHLYGR